MTEAEDDPLKDYLRSEKELRAIQSEIARVTREMQKREMEKLVYTPLPSIISMEELARGKGMIDPPLSVRPLTAKIVNQEESPAPEKTKILSTIRKILKDGF